MQGLPLCATPDLLLGLPSDFRLILPANMHTCICRKCLSVCHCPPVYMAFRGTWCARGNPYPPPELRPWCPLHTSLTLTCSLITNMVKKTDFLRPHSANVSMVLGVTPVSAPNGIAEGSSGHPVALAPLRPVLHLWPSCPSTCSPGHMSSTHSLHWCWPDTCLCPSFRLSLQSSRVLQGVAISDYRCRA